MAALVDQGMSEGAIGLSSGLEYEVGSYSDTKELVELAKAAAQARRLLHEPHPRRGGPRVRGASAKRSPSASRRASRSRSRTSSSGPSASGASRREVVRMIEAARKRGVDVTADCYPYDAWHSTITVLVPEQAVRRSRQREEGAGRRGRRAERDDRSRHGASRVRVQDARRDRESEGDHAGRAVHPDRQGRRRQRGREVDGRGGHPPVLRAAVGDGRPATAGSGCATRAAPARSRACSASSSASSTGCRCRRRSAR